MWGFAGTDGPFGSDCMVHPDHRRQGIFRLLSSLVFNECKRRGSVKNYLLCDRKSDSGQAFLKSLGAVYEYSEFEMYLNSDKDLSGRDLDVIQFKKATNADGKGISQTKQDLF